jgi:hypothetical protein
MNSVHSEWVDVFESPTSRRSGPPGIDWTSAAPECPICWRRWLKADAPAGRLFSRRTQAALTAAALTLSGSAPAIGVAASPHHGDDHGASPKQAGAGDPGFNPNFDPGGPGVDPAPAPDEPDDPDDPDPAPATPGPAAPRDPVGDAADPGPPPEEPPPPAPSEDPQPSPAPPDDATPPQAATPPPSSAPAATPIAVISTKRFRPERHVVYARSARSHRSSTIRPPARVGRVAPKTPTPVAAVARTVVAPHAYRPYSGHAHAGQRSHVVRPGESLWSIASDLLGGGASAARISREVGRLWQLNQARIGSGDPDVIAAGTTLILPKVS